MMPYLVWSYDYAVNSAGPKALHRLCHELNAAGQEAYIGPGWRTNPEWDTPNHPPAFDGDWIAVYPEVVWGNPWEAPHVARWVLNNPGKLGGSKTYDPAEMVFAFWEPFNDMGVPPERILLLPTIETDIFTDRHEARSGDVYYVGKSAKSRELPGAVEITRAMAADPHALADVLNHAERMWLFDNMTGMWDIARLCGCPVVLVPNGEYSKAQLDPWMNWAGLGWNTEPAPFDSDAFRASYLARWGTFRERLATFITITQGEQVAA